MARLSRGDALLEAARAGRVDEALIDDKVLGHLRISAARVPWLLRPDGWGSGAEVRFSAPRPRPSR